MRSTVLEIDADVGYPHAAVLEDVRLEVRPGEAVTLVGRNGSGKTTLLRTVAGLLRPRRGQVLVDGRPAVEQSSRRSVGYVPDPPPLYEELSPWEHLELLQRLWGTAVDDEALGEAVETFDLLDVLTQRCDSLSLGTRKRVGVALALLHRPRLVLLDEPFNGLDAASTEGLRAVLREHLAAGGAVLASTHQPQLMAGIATRGVAVQDGAVVYDGDPGRLPARGLAQSGAAPERRRARGRRLAAPHSPADLT